MMELTKQATLDDILPAVRELSAHDKLVLIRILVENLLSDPVFVLSLPGTVIEMNSPVEVSGDMSAFEKMLQPTPQK